MWQSLRLLAYDTGTLEGTRHDPATLSQAVAEAHAMRVCGPMWGLSDQSIDDCAHAAGHGFFYYFFDIGRVLQ
jgi:hypothetical protein